MVDLFTTRIAMPFPRLPACCAALLLSASATAADWQAMARADIEAVHGLILSAHPGSIDEQNPGFKDWTEKGYRQALALVPRVNNYDSMMAATRFYVTGFLDGHLVYSDNARGQDPIVVNGWRLRKQGSDYIVQERLANWPTALPPLGARLQECDGRSVDAIVAENVAPYFDRRKFGAADEYLPAALSAPALPDLLLKRCRFRTADGAALDYAVKYQAVPKEQFFAKWEQAPQQAQRGRRTSGYTFENGVLWVNAANFNSLPSKEQIAAFDTMVTELGQLKDVRLAVFDVRGNGGGSSAIGGKIFGAVTGGLEYDKQGLDKLPRTYAQWRVSDVLVGTLEKFSKEFAARFGEDSSQARQATAFLKEVLDAKAKGQAWVEQPDGPLVTRAEIARRGGKLQRFNGAVALLTDAKCASACLDFADLVLSVPGAIHLGRPTSADSLYIDVGRAKLPSGNVLVLPQKVWRNRLRGNNEVLVPTIVLKADMDDDAAVRAETLAALKPCLTAEPPSLTMRASCAK
jgi:hypothetical protein